MLVLALSMQRKAVGEPAEIDVKEIASILAMDEEKVRNIMNRILMVDEITGLEGVIASLLDNI